MIEKICYLFKTKPDLVEYYEQYNYYIIENNKKRIIIYIQPTYENFAEKNLYVFCVKRKNCFFTRNGDKTILYFNENFINYTYRQKRLLLFNNKT